MGEIDCTTYKIRFYGQDSCLHVQPSWQQHGWIKRLSWLMDCAVAGSRNHGDWSDDTVMTSSGAGNHDAPGLSISRRSSARQLHCLAVLHSVRQGCNRVTHLLSLVRTLQSLHGACRYRSVQGRWRGWSGQHHRGRGILPRVATACQGEQPLHDEGLRMVALSSWALDCLMQPVTAQPLISKYVRC